MISPPPEKTARLSHWPKAFALAFAALACGVLLTGLSVWFLGAVAIAGLSAAALTFNFHIPGALVRLFALGRTAAKYGERLVGHKAALEDQSRRRSDLFGEMASSDTVRRAGWQLGNQDRLADYLDDVEDLDNGRLRVDLPAFILGAGLLICLVATLFVAPLAILPIGMLAGMVAILARRCASSEAKALASARRARRAGGQRLGAAMASVVPLQAEAGWRAEVAATLSDFASAERDLLAIRRHGAVLDAALSAFGPLALLSVLGAAWLSGQRGEALLIPAFLAFAWFALAETAQGGSRILVAELRRRAAAQEIGRQVADGVERRKVSRPAVWSVPLIRLSALRRRAPDERLIGLPLTATFEAGRPTALVGPSGCGKTSLLKQIAGWLGEEADPSRVSLSAAERRALAMYCPHDAAILADTVRANLFAPSASDEDIRTALAAMELTERIEMAGGPDAWITQDVLSLGEAQRLNIARAWLSDHPIVLLDEPTEHLDGAQAVRILGRLLERLGDRIVVFSTHRADPDASAVLRLD